MPMGTAPAVGMVQLLPGPDVDTAAMPPPVVVTHWRPSGPAADAHPGVASPLTMVVALLAGLSRPIFAVKL